MREGGSGIPTSSSISTDRSKAALLETRSCTRTDSVICMPMVKTGFSEVMGSWKIMLISFPRIARISAHDRSSRFRP